MLCAPNVYNNINKKVTFIFSSFYGLEQSQTLEMVQKKSKKGFKHPVNLSSMDSSSHLSLKQDQ